MVTLFEEEQAPAPAQPLCASLRSRNAWWTSGKSQEQFYVRIFRKMSRLRPRQPFCASLRNRNAHGHVARAISYENSQAQCRRQRSKKSRAADFLRDSVQSKCTWRCHKSQFFIREFAGKKSRPETGKNRFCASLHSRNAHGHVRILCENSQVNCRRPRSRMAHVADFVRACTVEMHTRAHKRHKRLAQIPLDMQTVRRATLCENFQVKCRRPISSKPRGADFARACAVEMHMDIAQEPVYARIYRKEAGSQMEHPDQAPVFTPTVTTPQCGHNVWGTYCNIQNEKHANKKRNAIQTAPVHVAGIVWVNCLLFFTKVVPDSASLKHSVEFYVVVCCC